jgi:hypothetical protein
MATHNTWIPAHLKFGDPMGRIDQGELLFPGSGYEALYPELQGVNPEDYPLAHRYNILSNVAPWSESFRRTARTLEDQERTGQLSSRDLDMVKRINNRLRQSALRRDFLSELNQSTENMGVVSKMARSLTTGTIEGIKQVFGPAEYMMPFGIRPFSKFLPEGTPIQEYKRDMVYGCLAKDTLLLTMNGIKRVQDICIGDMVYTHDGVWKKVLNLVAKEFDSLSLEMCSVKVAGLSGVDICLTQDHQLLIGPNAWTRTDKLSVSYTLAYPIPTEPLCKNQSLDLLQFYLNFGGTKALIDSTNQTIKLGSIRNGQLLGCNKSRPNKRYITDFDKLSKLVNAEASDEWQEANSAIAEMDEEFELIEKERNKTGQQFKVYMTDKALECVTKLIQLSDDESKPFQLPSIDYINRIYGTIQDMCGIRTKITTYTLRHSYAVHYMEHDGRLEDLQKMLGHSNIKTTQIYGRINDKRLSEKMKELQSKSLIHQSKNQNKDQLKKMINDRMDYGQRIIKHPSYHK